MQEFSLEKISEQIHYGKTKDYFQEVLSSYNNGNYRSAVVMLWSVAICDIVYKLQYLIDLYDDEAAKQILNDVTTMQVNEPKSSAWELSLLDDVLGKTNLLDSSEYEDLRYLQKQRHLSAHPVLNSERELHAPNKETVRSLLRNTLQNLLIKPPFYTQRIMDELLEDLAEASSALNTRPKVKKYLESRYLNRITPAVQLKLFRSFWKLVFKLNNKECDKNRTINLFTLEVLADRNIAAIPTEIRDEIDYYNNIASEGMPVAFLVYFLSKNSQIYSILSDDARLKIDHCINTDHIGKLMGWFVKTDLNTHAEDLERWIVSAARPSLSSDEFTALLEISDSEEWQNKFCKIVTAYYCISTRFDEADIRFQMVIRKYISLFSRDMLVHLAEQINSNGQCLSRSKAEEDHAIIKERIDQEFDDDFDYGGVPSFAKTVTSKEC